MATKTDLSIHGIVDLAEDAQRAWERIEEFGLVEQVAQIAALGYAVIPPEKVGPMSDVIEAREAILALAAAEDAQSSDYTTYQEGLSYEMYHLVKQGRIFEKWLVNPTVLALAKYLVGEQMILNNSLAFVKSKTPNHLGIHSDSLMVPDPLPDHLVLVNMTIALTDYTFESGCIGVVPGSHRYRRHPTPPEANMFETMRPVECPAGSVVVVPGNTWHGAFPKTNDGFRVTLVQAYSRQHLVPSVTHQIDQEIIDRNGDEFKQLLGQNMWTGLDERGFPDMDQHFATYRSHRSHYA